MTIEMALAQKCRNRTARIAVVGLGYAGLPLALLFSEAGFQVVGIDLDNDKVDSLNAGRSYLKHVSSECVVAARRPGPNSFTAETDFSCLADVDCILICVPTPLNMLGEPDLSHVRAATECVASFMKYGALVVLESTTYPGTTKDLVRPILEAEGVIAGVDFFLAYSPEREDPCNVDYHTKDIPRVVGGYSDACLRAASALYGTVVARTVPVSSLEVAEGTKLLENVYRAVNISLINEMKTLYDRMGIDIWEAISAASSKPFGFAPFYPGPGSGGHCIPVDPCYLSWKARQLDMTARFVDLTVDINAEMPAYVADKVDQSLIARGKTTDGARVLLLGIAYKRNVDDVRESPSVKLHEVLTQRGALVDYSDPHVPFSRDLVQFGKSLKSVPLTASSLSSYDCVVLVTDHAAFDAELIARHARLIIDTRNFFTDTFGAANIVKA